MTIDGTTSQTNPLAAMLGKAFDKFDQNKDGKLDTAEFASFDEILKPGNAMGSDGKPRTDFSKKMDRNSDGSITKQEMDDTTVLMPASLTGDTFGSLVSYLNLQGTTQSLDAAALLGDES